MHDRSQKPARPDHDRRQFLRRAGGLVVAAGVASPLLGACTASTRTGGRSGVGGTIEFLSWEGYDLPKATKAWRTEHDVKFNSTYISTHDDIQAKLKSGARISYDITTYYQGFYDLYRRLEILGEIDESKIPNLKLLDPYFQDSPVAKQFWTVDGKRWGVPFTWGTTTCDYRPDKTDPPESWLDLLKSKYKGKVGWSADATGAFTLAGCILGFDIPDYTKKEFKEAAALLRKFRDQTNGMASSFGDLTNQFVSGDVIVDFAGWAALGAFAKPKGVTIESVVPKEGSYSFCDALAIPSTVDNPDTAHAWINEALRPEVQAKSAESLSAGVVVSDAAELVPKATQAIYPDVYTDGVAAHMSKAPPYGAPSEDNPVTKKDWISEFARIQSGD
ncbi:MAG: ABC transporter substrate-binding protein [Micromonosporaceae bacterium]